MDIVWHHVSSAAVCIKCLYHRSSQNAERHRHQVDSEVSLFIGPPCVITVCRLSFMITAYTEHVQTKVKVVSFRAVSVTNSIRRHCGVFLDPETGLQALGTLFLLLCLFLLLWDFSFRKDPSFLKRWLWNFSHIIMIVFCIRPPWRNFDLGPNLLVIIINYHLLTHSSSNGGGGGHERLQQQRRQPRRAACYALLLLMLAPSVVRMTGLLSPSTCGAGPAGLTLSSTPYFDLRA